MTSPLTSRTACSKSRPSKACRPKSTTRMIIDPIDLQPLLATALMPAYLSAMDAYLTTCNGCRLPAISTIPNASDCQLVVCLPVRQNRCQIDQSLQGQPLEVLVEVLLPHGGPLQVFLVGPLILADVRHLERGLEDVDSVEGSAHHHLVVDGVKTDLLDFLLPLVEEEQFVGHLGVALLVLDRHVPDGEPVVLARHRDDRLLVGLEADGGDRLGVPVEAEHLLVAPLGHHAQVPDLDGAVVGASHDQVRGHLVPVADVDVLFVGVDAQLRLLVVVGAHVDQLEGAVGGAWVRGGVQEAKTQACSGEKMMSSTDPVWQLYSEVLAQEVQLALLASTLTRPWLSPATSSPTLWGFQASPQPEHSKGMTISLHFSLRLEPTPFLSFSMPALKSMIRTSPLAPLSFQQATMGELLRVRMRLMSQVVSNSWMTTSGSSSFSSLPSGSSSYLVWQRFDHFMKIMLFLFVLLQVPWTVNTSYGYCVIAVQGVRAASNGDPFAMKSIDIEGHSTFSRCSMSQALLSNSSTSPFDSSLLLPMNTSGFPDAPSSFISPLRGPWCAMPSLCLGSDIMVPDSLTSSCAYYSDSDWLIQPSSSSNSSSMGSSKSSFLRGSSCSSTASPSCAPSSCCASGFSSEAISTSSAVPEVFLYLMILEQALSCQYFLRCIVVVS